MELRTSTREFEYELLLVGMNSATDFPSHSVDVITHHESDTDCGFRRPVSLLPNIVSLLKYLEVTKISHQDSEPIQTVTTYL